LSTTLTPFIASYGELRVLGRLHSAAWEDLTKLRQSVSKHGVQDGAALTFKVLLTLTTHAHYIPASSTLFTLTLTCS
jgi:hypothetical protein